jgi:hypothetical protein
MSVSTLAKSAYVLGIRIARVLARRIGLLAVLEREPVTRLRHWVRSLFAIYDLDDMIYLDAPWWTYAAIDRVGSFLAAHPEARVFEWGSGASTVWLAKRAGSVITVEHDEAWHDAVRARIAGLSNVEALIVPAKPAAPGNSEYGSTKPGCHTLSFERYVKAIDDVDGGFDLVVIDCRSRNACLQVAASRLAPAGMIVFDNSGRRR